MSNESDTKNGVNAVLKALGHPYFMGPIGVAVVLFFLLLFARDLADPSGFRNYLIGALTIYLVGTLFLIQIRIDLVDHARKQAEKIVGLFPSFEKSPTSQRWPRIAPFFVWCEDFANVLGYITLRCIPLLHAVLLVLLITYLFWRKCL